MTYTFSLPLPPSVNKYWRHVGTHHLICRAGRDYRKTVVSIIQGLYYAKAIKSFGADAALAVQIDFYVPDNRRRDLDNFLKAPLDALKYAGLYADDSQIKRILVEHCGVVRGGTDNLIITISEHTPKEAPHVGRIEPIDGQAAGGLRVDQDLPTKEREDADFA